MCIQGSFTKPADDACVNHATKSLADEAVQLRGATQSLIQRLQAA